MREVKIVLLSEHSGAVIEHGSAVKGEHGAWVYRNKTEVADAGDVVVRLADEGLAVAA